MRGNSFHIEVADSYYRESFLTTFKWITRAQIWEKAMLISLFSVILELQSAWKSKAICVTRHLVVMDWIGLCSWQFGKQRTDNEWEYRRRWEENQENTRLRAEELVAQLAIFCYVEDVIIEWRDKRILLGTCQPSDMTNITKDLDLLYSALLRHREEQTFRWVALDCHQTLLLSLLF